VKSKFYIFYIWSCRSINKITPTVPHKENLLKEKKVLLEEGLNLWIPAYTFIFSIHFANTVVKKIVMPAKTTRGPVGIFK